MEKWIKYLQFLGLSETDSKVYLAFLKSGPETVLSIAKQIGLSRVSVYSSIDKLITVGLMSSVEKGKKQVYASEPPERIVTLVENRANDIKAMIKRIKDDVEELKLSQGGDKPLVKMFEGPNAYKAIQEDVLNSEIKHLSEFGNPLEIDKICDYNEINAFSEKLNRKKIKRKFIYFNNKTEKTEEVYELHHTKILKNVNNFCGDIFIYSDKVWLSGFRGKQTSVMIQNKDIKDTLQTLFDSLWDRMII